MNPFESILSSFKDEMMEATKEQKELAHELIGQMKALTRRFDSMSPLLYLMIAELLVLILQKFLSE